VSKETWCVLNKHEPGSKLPNKTGELKPKTRASWRAIRIEESGPLSGLANVLAGEAAGQ